MVEKVLSEQTDSVSLETFIGIVSEHVGRKLGENAVKNLGEETIREVATKVYQSPVFATKKMVFAINKVVRDLQKRVIRADLVLEGYFISASDQINPRKEDVPRRQVSYFFDPEEKEIYQVTVFGHTPNFIINGEKTREHGRFVPFKKYKLYCSKNENFDTATANFVEELDDVLEPEVFYNYLKENAITPEDLTREHLYKPVILKATIRYVAGLDIVGEDKSQPKKQLIINGKPQYDDEGNPIMVYPIATIGTYPVICSRIDEKYPDEANFVGRIKLVRPVDAEETEEDVNYVECVVYPQRLGQTRVCLTGLNELIDGGIVEFKDPELQRVSLSDYLANTEAYFFGRVTQYNKDPTRNIIWIKVNASFITDNPKCLSKLDGLKVEPFSVEEVTIEPSEKVGEVDEDDDIIAQIKEVLNSTSVMMLGKTNYKTLKELGRFDHIDGLDDSYEPLVNQILADMDMLA